MGVEKMFQKTLLIIATFYACQALNALMILFTILACFIIAIPCFETVQQICSRQDESEKFSLTSSSKDSFEWIHRILSLLWSNQRNFAREMFDKWLWSVLVEELNDTSIGKMWKDLYMEKFYIGDQPPKIHQISCWIQNNDLLFDIELDYHGNAFFKACFDTGLAKIPVTIQNIVIENAKLRIVLKKWSGIHLGFLEAPKVDWDINNLAGIADIPGFDELIMHFINVRLTNRVVLPRMLIFPLTKMLPPKLFSEKDCLTENMMLSPLAIIRVMLFGVQEMAKSKKWSENIKIQLVLNDQMIEKNHVNLDQDWNIEALFPIEHLYKQRLKISILFKHKVIASLTEDVEKIAHQRVINDCYQFQESQGKMKIMFEAIQITNERRAILETRSFGVISVFLKGIANRSQKIRPVIYLQLIEAGNQVTKWTSLEPLTSCKNQELCEATLLHVKNILDESVHLTIRVWNARTSSWLGDQHIFNVKKLLLKAVNDHTLALDDETIFQFSLSLYHA